jgi:branched-chain amino acid aminotransferase
MPSLVLVDGHEPGPGLAPTLLTDAALWTGHAVFETLRTYSRRPWRVRLHLERLAASVAWMRVPPFDAGVIAAELDHVAARFPVETKLNVLLTAGGRRIVKGEVLEGARVGAPVRVATRPWAPPPWLPGRIKHTSRAAWTLAALEAGTDEVLWVDPEGLWLEANRSNLVVVRGGVLRTPPDDGRILQGVTRDALLAAARVAGLEFVEEPVPAGPCEEMYLCSTLKELAPVAELDGAPGPGGGPLGNALLDAFHAFRGET